MAGKKLTPAVHTAICRAVAAGVSVVKAANLVRVAEATVLEWIARGEGRDDRGKAEIYVAFAEAIAHARAQDEARRVARIEQAGQGGLTLDRTTTEFVDADGRVTKRVIEEHRAAPQWQADAWHLERTRPQDWGLKKRVDAGWQVGGDVRIVHDVKDAEQSAR